MGSIPLLFVGTGPLSIPPLEPAIRSYGAKCRLEICGICVICGSFLALKTTTIVSPELFGLLKNVSRSFYLSVRFLPEQIRQTVGLAYLLARGSDTIADTNRLDPGKRLEVLANLSRS